MMKNSKLHLVGLAAITVIAAVIISCEKDEDSKPPMGITNRIDIKADSIKNILYRNAKAYGSVGDYKNITFSQYGHCWDTLETPTIDNNKTEFQNLTAKSVFTSNLSNLKPNKTYYIRSYAKTNSITVYSEIVNFQTRALEAPVLTTDSTTQIASTSANIWGAIALDGGTDISAKGVCWGITENPTLQNQHAEFTGAQDTFKVPLTGLEKYTTYYARIYAVNQTGTGYGNIVTFKTLAEQPQLTTAEVTSITAYTATGGGTITSNGGAEITTRGICWGLDPNPTISNNQCVASVGTDNYTCNLTNLQPGKVYHVRAFATNVSGTAYGNDVTFITPPVLPSITTIEVTNITATNATTGGNVTDDGGATVTERGVCWSKNQYPTTDINYGIITNYEQTASFICNLSDLTANTTYYLRTYAINSAGTTYGNQVTFTTLMFNDGPGGSVTDIEGNIYNTIWINGRQWMKENLKTSKYNDGSTIPLVIDNSTWSSLNSPAYCWYNFNQTTYEDTYGALYNWYAINTNKLCPTDWHVPSNEEWTSLLNYLGGTNVSGGALKATVIWASPNIGATNSSGFTALPGGGLYDMGFSNVSYSGHWWTSSEIDSETAIQWFLEYNTSRSLRGDYYKKNGFSVRCIKNN